MNPFITTKNKKNNNNHIWIWVMVIIIFLICCSSYIFSQEYDSFLFYEDPQWQYVEYLSYNATINVGIVDTGRLADDQNYDLLGEYSSGNSESWDTHGSDVISMIKSPPVSTVNWGVFRGICPKCALLYADIDSGSGTDLTEATEWAIDNGAQLINYSNLGSSNDEFVNVINESLEDPSFFIITGGGNTQIPTWGYDEFSDHVWSIGGLNKFQDAILDKYITIEDNPNIKFSAPAQNMLSYNGFTDGTSFSSPLFLGAVARILAHTNNGYSRSELYDLLVSYGTPIPEGEYKVRWGDLIRTEFNISRTRKSVLVKDVNGNEATLIVDLIYENGTYIKSYLYRFEFDHVTYKINTEL